MVFYPENGSGMRHAMLVVGVMQIENQVFIKYNDPNANKTSDWVTYEEFANYNLNGAVLNYKGSYM